MEISDYSGEKHEFCLLITRRVNPDMDIELRKILESRNGKHFFEDYEKLQWFLAELNIENHKHHWPTFTYIIREGKDVRLYTSATLVFLHDFITYEVIHDFDFLCPHKDVKITFDNAGCDCIRSGIIRMTLPEFPPLLCGKTVELLNLKITDKRYE